MTKIEALAKHLECDIGDLTEQDFDSNCFKIQNELYLVLTDSEADELAKENILETIWAFNANFLAAHSDLDPNDIQLIQDNGKCEDNNKLLTKLINDLDHFVDDAIRCDGRGHFLATYNNNEEFMEGYYIYRTN